MNERRKKSRSRSLLAGEIHFTCGQSAARCAVQDLSPEGARVVYSELFRMPSEFTLAIPRQRQKHAARVIWRRGDTAGVALSPLANEAAAPRRPPARIWLQGRRRPESKVFVLGY